MPTLYDATIKTFIRELNTLKNLLNLGIAHAADSSNAVTEQSLIDARLIADMHNLASQIQRVSDTSKGFATRVGKLEPLKLEDNEKTFPELFERINKTIAYLETVKPEQINADEKAIVELPQGKYAADDYALQYAIPNFYFHFVTAYDILRAQGVPVGKKHYLGRA